MTQACLHLGLLCTFVPWQQVEHESIAWIQKKFLSTYEALSDKMKARYDPKDVDRVRNDPEYVASFVLAKSMQRSEVSGCR